MVLAMNSERAEPWNIGGKTVVVTGGNAGIGKATVLSLARQGAHVIFTSRDVGKGQAALEDLLASLTGHNVGSVALRILDLASFESIETFAQGLLSDVPRLHVLVHNAGLIQAQRQETTDGFEVTFGTNHMGPFRLNQLLVGRLRESAPSRIVVVTSNAHARTSQGLRFSDLQAEKGYDPVSVYGASKLANILFTRELSMRLAGTGVTVNCLHPGVVASSFNRVGGVSGLWGFAFKWLRPLLLTPEKGARTTVHLCTAPEVASVTGAYFDRCKERLPSKAALDDQAAARLWEVSEELCRSVPLSASTAS
jgi:NAD(P)-dependent dehydrogenase (short-subunit alcohol dehydrogenase family)